MCAFLTLGPVRSALAGTGSPIIAYMAMIHVTVDGKWTIPDEWTDSINTTLGLANRFHVKHDDGFLYFLIDYVSDRTMSNGDVSWVYVDTKNDGGSAPRTDDYGFTVGYSGGFFAEMTIGTGTGWGPQTRPITGFFGSIGWDASLDPYSTTSHRIYEYKIPKVVLGESTKVGLRVAARDGETDTWVMWPLGSLRDKLDQWGILEISSMQIPEFPTIALPLIFFAATLCALALAKHRKRSRNQPTDSCAKCESPSRR